MSNEQPFSALEAYDGPSLEQMMNRVTLRFEGAGLSVPWPVRHYNEYGEAVAEERPPTRSRSLVIPDSSGSLAWFTQGNRFYRGEVMWNPDRYRAYAQEVVRRVVAITSSYTSPSVSSWGGPNDGPTPEQAPPFPTFPSLNFNSVDGNTDLRAVNERKREILQQIVSTLREAMAWLGTLTHTPRAAGFVDFEKREVNEATNEGSAGETYTLSSSPSPGAGGPGALTGGGGFWFFQSGGTGEVDCSPKGEENDTDYVEASIAFENCAWVLRVTKCDAAEGPGGKWVKKSGPTPKGVYNKVEGELDPGQITVEGD